MIILVPDIHCRPFYKDVLSNKVDRIIFLGDYLDPYAYEGYLIEDGIANLEEIIDFKNKNKDRVTLLLGNHDCGYIWPAVCSSRRSSKYYSDIKFMFTKNLNLFDLAVQENKCLISHAGIHKDWYDLLYKLVNKELPKNYNNVANYINNLLHLGNSELAYALEIYSNYRGWSGLEYGSCVWADVREWLNNSDTMDYFQIFGHTQLTDEPIITKDIACIDVRRIFILNNNVLIDNDRKITTLWEK